jgi:hypothetical protein
LAALCDARHIKKPRVNRAKLQQAAAKLLSKDDARRIAVNIARLWELSHNSFCSILAKASSM